MGDHYECKDCGAYLSHFADCELRGKIRVLKGMRGIIPHWLYLAGLKEIAHRWSENDLDTFYRLAGLKLTEDQRDGIARDLKIGVMHIEDVIETYGGWSGVM